MVEVGTIKKKSRSGNMILRDSLDRCVQFRIVDY